MQEDIQNTIEQHPEVINIVNSALNELGVNAEQIYEHKTAKSIQIGINIGERNNVNIIDHILNNFKNNIIVRFLHNEDDLKKFLPEREICEENFERLFSTGLRFALQSMLDVLQSKLTTNEVPDIDNLYQDTKRNVISNLYVRF